MPLYAYEFRDQSAPFYFPPMPGFVAQAYHTSDIQYYWPLYHGGAAGTPHPLNRQQENLSDDLVAAWTNFARTGNPNGPGGSARPWPRYSVSNGPFLAEGPIGLSTESDAFWVTEHHCAFWDKVLGLSIDRAINARLIVPAGSTSNGVPAGNPARSARSSRMAPAWKCVRPITRRRYASYAPKIITQMALAAETHHKRDICKRKVRVVQQTLCTLYTPFNLKLMGGGAARRPP